MEVTQWVVSTQGLGEEGRKGVTTGRGMGSVSIVGDRRSQGKQEKHGLQRRVIADRPSSRHVSSRSPQWGRKWAEI
jgi:hypothetical protein